MLWCTVWLSRMSFQTTNGLAITYLRQRERRLGQRQPGSLTSFLFLLQKISHVFGICWFLYGFNLIWFEAEKPERVYTWAKCLWWCQATVYLVPCVLYSLMCFCFPCILFLVIRSQIPQNERNPTPPDIRGLLKPITFGQLLIELRNKYGWVEPSRVETSNLVNPLSVLNVVGGAFRGKLLDSGEVRLPTRTSSADSYTDLNQTGPACHFNTSCPICFSEFNDADQLLVMPCDQRHFFHKACIENWLEHSQICPICRANIVDLLTTNDAEATPLRPDSGGIQYAIVTDMQNDDCAENDLAEVDV